VLTPDGLVIVVGGSDSFPAPFFGNNAAAFYFPTAERFDPGNPTDLGTWTTLASTANPGDAGFFTPRGYHTVALLLADGAVAMMGGRFDNRGLAWDDFNPEASVEIFKPPYSFYANRPAITSATLPAALLYNTTATITITQGTTNPIARACLIGVSSVTHHFDYGQRYVELMVRERTETTSDPDDFEIYIPSAELLPEGYYLLFAVESRTVPLTGNVFIPSIGQFVKVGF
jgi:hypothetical protein